MTSTTTKIAISISRVCSLLAVVLLFSAAARGTTPGVSGTAFNLSARPAFISQPDGSMVYSWGYSCNTGGSAVPFDPGTACNGTMQVPGPTLIVQAPASGTTTVTVTLTNDLPAHSGNTSILFPGFLVSTSGGVAGLLTQEAAPGNPVTYTLTIPSTAAGTHSYYSGTQGDLQVEMGLYGAIVVVPAVTPSACTSGTHVTNLSASTARNETVQTLAPAAYNHVGACYDREYLFQFSEMDPRIHRQVEEQLAAISSCVPSATVFCPTSLNVATEPYVPAYFMVNGRSMPDLMDASYTAQYPHQPYNGNPHMHPGELVLLRIIGQGRWQHPFHEHGNHVRVLARDGNLITSTSNSDANLAGPLLFTTTTTPGQTIDGIFYWTGKGLNWDAYGHNPASSDPGAKATCSPNENGYDTSDPAATNYFEWCQDHNKPLQATPVGDVPGGGPATLPDPNIFANGAWYGGSPYLGPNATIRAVGSTGTTPPSGTVGNVPSEEAGFAFMWHSHNEREITTNNIFPGGMMMMMLVDSREFVIDEKK